MIALTWRWLLDLYRGLFNVGLHDLGIIGGGIHWLGNPDLAMLSVIMANVWRGFPFFGVSFLAAMQTVPQDLYDAASVDGASACSSSGESGLPSIKGVVAIVTLLSTIWTLNDFNIVYIMTRGGPGAATHILPRTSYELGIQSQRWAWPLAASMYSLPVIALLIIFVVPTSTGGAHLVSGRLFRWLVVAFSSFSSPASLLDPRHLLQDRAADPDVRSDLHPQAVHDRELPVSLRGDPLRAVAPQQRGGRAGGTFISLTIGSAAPMR